MADWRNPNSGNVAGQQSMTRSLSGIARGNLAFGALDATLNMAAGDDAGTAIMKAGAATALWYTAPVLMGTHMAATMTPAIAAAYHGWQRNVQTTWNNNFRQGQLGGQYQDTQRALTMRQAAVQAIQGSKLNARSALGGEARILASGWQQRQ